AETDFPSVVAEFVVDWNLGTPDSCTPGAPESNDLVKLSDFVNNGGSFLSNGNGLQFVGFKHIGLDLGSYFTNFIEPIAKKIQEYTAPIKPFLDFVTAPIPIISDLAGPTSLLDIAASSGEVSPEFVQAVKLVDKIVDIANQLVVPSGDAILYFGASPTDPPTDHDGEFPIFDNRNGSGTLMTTLANPGAALQAALNGQIKLPKSWGALGMDISTALNAVAPVLKDAISSMEEAAGATPETKFSLPIL